VSLAKAFSQGPPLIKGPACSVAATLEQLNDEDKAALETVLADKRWRSTDIAAQLQAEGISISDSTLSRHRRGACKCRHLGVT
jgi:DNA-binding HxlR family transcriptional regulator